MPSDRQRPAVGERHSEAGPFGHRLALLGPLQRARDARRYLGLDAPAAFALPALRLQVVRHRGETVGHRAPDIALAVAVEVDGIFAEERGHELRLAHRTGPRGAHGRRCDVAALDDLKCRDQLGPEEILAVAHEGLGGQRSQRRFGQRRPAEAGLLCPDRDEDGGRYAIALVDGAQRLAPLVDACPAHAGEGGKRLLVEIGARAAELGLPFDARRLHRLAGRRQFRQAPVERHPGKRPLEGRARHAGGFRLRPDVRLQPCLELGFHLSAAGRRQGGGYAGEQQQDGGEDTDDGGHGSCLGHSHRSRQGQGEVRRVPSGRSGRAGPNGRPGATARRGTRWPDRWSLHWRAPRLRRRCAAR